MSDIHTFTSAGMPVYYQHIPGEMNPVSFELLVMAGSADDESVGAPGIMHWFEHVPFRGTELFPQGQIELSPGFSRNGGSLNAYTSSRVTNYHAFVPKEYAKSALTAIVDLAARPLLRDEDVDAERTIIKEEIRQSLSSATGFASYTLPHMLWGAHPMGHPTLGTPESLDSLTAAHLRDAHAKLYSKRTMQLFASGSLPPADIEALTSEVLTVVPNSDVPERHSPHSYGLMGPWKPGTETIHTEFDTSLVYMLFPLEESTWSSGGVWRYGSINWLLTAGDLASPLLRTVREERQLCYETRTIRSVNAEGGYFGFFAKCKKENIHAVIAAFGDVLALPEIRSRERWDFCRDGYEGHFAMRIPHPASKTDSMIDSLFATGTVSSEEDMFARGLALTQEEVLKTYNTLALDSARIIIFEGK